MPQGVGVQVPLRADIRRIRDPHFTISLECRPGMRSAGRVAIAEGDIPFAALKARLNGANTRRPIASPKA